jgi:hypothetical protein
MTVQYLLIAFVHSGCSWQIVVIFNLEFPEILISFFDKKKNEALTKFMKRLGKDVASNNVEFHDFFVDFIKSLPLELLKHDKFMEIVFFDSASSVFRPSVLDSLLLAVSLLPRDCAVHLKLLHKLLNSLLLNTRGDFNSLKLDSLISVLEFFSLDQIENSLGLIDKSMLNVKTEKLKEVYTERLSCILRLVSATNYSFVSILPL